MFFVRHRLAGVTCSCYWSGHHFGSACATSRGGAPTVPAAPLPQDEAPAGTRSLVWLGAGPLAAPPPVRSLRNIEAAGSRAACRR